MGVASGLRSQWDALPPRAGIRRGDGESRVRFPSPPSRFCVLRSGSVRGSVAGSVACARGWSLHSSVLRLPRPLSAARSPITACCPRAGPPRNRSVRSNRAPTVDFSAAAPEGGGLFSIPPRRNATLSPRTSRRRWMSCTTPDPPTSASRNPPRGWRHRGRPFRRSLQRKDHRSNPKRRSLRKGFKRRDGG